MSKLKRDLYRKKLRNLLSRADDEAFFQLIWALDALQSGREPAAARLIRFPLEAVTSKFDSPFAVHKWELDTLIGQLLITRKVGISAKSIRYTDCSQFNAGSTAINFLRQLEEADSAIFLEHFDVLLEMHRIGQRQFPWQRGYTNINRLYRYAMMYGQGECSRYFARVYGLSINDFCLIGLAMYGSFQKRPWLARSYPIEQLGIKHAAFEIGLKLLSMSIKEARAEAVSLAREAGRISPVAYQRSFLRQYPLVSFGKDNERLRAPLPQLIVFRITSGLYYDLLPGGQELLNEANDRFERYVQEYIQAMMPGFDVRRSYKYGPKRSKIDSPDIIIWYGGQIAVVVECKATKLTFAAQYAEDPMIIAQRSYDQIAKGVFQLWRYFSHVRRGMANTDNVSPSVHGIVLTLDTWLVMARNLQEEVIATAMSLADENPDIKAEDRRAVAFCAIEDLETTLSRTDEDSFMRVLETIDEDRFVGWVLPDIYRKLDLSQEEPKPFPFRLDDVLPSWNATSSGLASQSNV